jgi:hypothetical protein
MVNMFEGARRQAAETMDRVFETVEIGRQMVVKKSDAGPKNQTPIPKSLMKSARVLVKMWGLEPQTPYMRIISGPMQPEKGHIPTLRSGQDCPPRCIP